MKLWSFTNGTVICVCTHEMLKINNVEESNLTVYAKPILEIPRLSVEITVFHTQIVYPHELT